MLAWSMGIEKDEKYVIVINHIPNEGLGKIM
jgi:hypothetical protein